MYLWDINHLVEDLKNNKIPTSQIRLYYILSPLMSILNGVLFGVLLLGHHVVQYSFKDWLRKNHPLMDFYDEWALGVALLTICIAFIGIYLCYRANKQGDGKNFWQRMACLSFPINFHITLYALAILALLGFIGYFFLQAKIDVFKKGLWPVDETVNTVLEKAAGDNPLAQVTIKTAQKQKGFFGAFLAAPGVVVAAPLIPMRIQAFIKDLRALILMYYPVLSLVPAFLSFLHYVILYRTIKKITQQPQS